MTDQEYREAMESLQFSGHKVKWYVHRVGYFSTSEFYFSRAIAEQIARQSGKTVTPHFC